MDVAIRRKFHRPGPARFSLPACKHDHATRQGLQANKCRYVDRRGWLAAWHPLGFPPFNDGRYGGTSSPFSSTPDHSTGRLPKRRVKTLGLLHRRPCRPPPRHILRSFCFLAGGPSLSSTIFGLGRLCGFPRLKNNPTDEPIGNARLRLAIKSIAIDHRWELIERRTVCGFWIYLLPRIFVLRRDAPSPPVIFVFSYVALVEWLVISRCPSSSLSSFLQGSARGVQFQIQIRGC